MHIPGVLPFWGKNHNAVFTSVVRADPDFTRTPWPLISTEARSLVRRMLTSDPTIRISMADVLRHSWIVRHSSFSTTTLSSSSSHPSSHS